MALLSFGSGNRVALSPSQELLEFEAPTTAVIVTPVRPMARSMGWLLAVLVMGLILVSALMPIDIVVTGNGMVTSLENTVVVQPLETSIVRNVAVREGELVRAGQVLAKLDPTFAGSDEQMYRKQAESLQAWVDRLRAELDRKPYRPAQATPDTILQSALYTQRKAAFDYQVDSYNQKISMYQAQVSQATADIQGYTQRLKVVAELEAKRVELEKLQVGSQIDRLQATDTRLELTRDLADAMAQQQQAQKSLAGSVADRDYYIQNWYAQASQDLRDQSSNLSDARENLRKAQLRHQMVELRADQDAWVLQVAKVSAGSVVNSGDALVTLVPTNAHLEIESDVTGDQSGYVHPGDYAQIKFQTFNFIKYGTAEGKVRTISANSFTSMSSLAQSGSVPNGSSSQNMPPFYKVRVAIDKVNMHDVPGGFHLVPGMPVETDINVGHQTAFEYLMGSLLAMPFQAMREP